MTPDESTAAVVDILETSHRHVALCGVGTYCVCPTCDLARRIQHYSETRAAAQSQREAAIAGVNTAI